MGTWTGLDVARLHVGRVRSEHLLVRLICLQNVADEVVVELILLGRDGLTQKGVAVAAHRSQELLE